MKEICWQLLQIKGLRLFSIRIFLKGEYLKNILIMLYFKITKGDLNPGGVTRMGHPAGKLAQIRDQNMHNFGMFCF